MLLLGTALWDESLFACLRRLRQQWSLIEMVVQSGWSASYDRTFTTSTSESKIEMSVDIRFDAGKLRYKPWWRGVDKLVPCREPVVIGSMALIRRRRFGRPCQRVRHIQIGCFAVTIRGIESRTLSSFASTASSLKNSANIYVIYACLSEVTTVQTSLTATYTTGVLAMTQMSTSPSYIWT